MSFDTQQNSNTKVQKQPKSVGGKPVSVGNGFKALSFDHGNYNGAMDPLIMVDHFVMTEPTFGPHAHAGLSAVSILFEDSRGLFHNKDSLGNDIDLRPGDLYWLMAGRGAVHDEKPRPGSHTHALQVFANLPARLKYDAPESLHVKASTMPILSGNGYRARLLLGESGQIKSKISPALPITILDVKLEKEARFEHIVPSGQAVFILSVDGIAKIQLGRQTASLHHKESVTFRQSASDDNLTITTKEPAHIVIFQAAPINEPFVHRGPFAMSTLAENRAMFAAHKAGQLGSIDR